MKQEIKEIAYGGFFLAAFAIAIYVGPAVKKQTDEWLGYPIKECQE